MRDAHNTFKPNGDYAYSSCSNLMSMVITIITNQMMVHFSAKENQLCLIFLVEKEVITQFQILLHQLVIMHLDVVSDHH